MDPIEKAIRDALEPEIQGLVAETNQNVRNFAAKWKVDEADVIVTINQADPGLSISFKARKKY
jgi:hypothetical protein